MAFPRQEYWSGLPFPSSRNLPDPGFESAYPPLAGGLFTTEPPAKPSGTNAARLFLSTPTFLEYGRDVQVMSSLPWGVTSGGACSKW